ncbi:MFS transporter [Neobacillus kokaensis]|uniref:MFS transporter n=1 Tax=Neobacillus kokaensis TaxID=2759023 RepID=A0ABQ3N6L7_9BACI|nr:MFS transporter [Neobacillus kokaensis]GHH99799.1 MFS transporter [Neobacillus kokaensis]
MEKKGFFTYENRLLIILFFSMGFVFLDRLAITFLFPFITAEFNLTNFQIGILGAAVSLAWAVSGPMIGLMADKANNRKKFMISLMLIFSVISFVQGLAMGFAALLILRLLIGLFEGPFLPIAQSMMAIESTPKRRGFNMGFIQVTPTGLFGGVLAPLVLVALANAFNWRFAFYFTIIPGIIMALIMLKFLREPNLPKNEVVSTTVPNSESKIKIMDVIKNRNIWLSMIICGFALTWFNVFAVFAPTYLVNIKGFSTSEMSVIMSVAGAAAMVWGLVVPAISDKLGRKPLMTLFALISALSPLVILYSNAPIVIFALLIFLFHTGQGFHPIFMAIVPAESTSPLYVGFAIGLIMGFGEITGGVIAPILAGYLADVFGLGAPLWICVGSAIGATIVSCFIKETAPVKIKHILPEVSEGKVAIK